MFKCVLTINSILLQLILIFTIFQSQYISYCNGQLERKLFDINMNNSDQTVLNNNANVTSNSIHKNIIISKNYIIHHHTPEFCNNQLFKRIVEESLLRAQKLNKESFNDLSRSIFQFSKTVDDLFFKNDYKGRCGYADFEKNLIKHLQEMETMTISGYVRITSVREEILELISSPSFYSENFSGGICSDHHLQTVLENSIKSLLTMIEDIFTDIAKKLQYVLIIVKIGPKENAFLPETRCNYKPVKDKLVYSLTDLEKQTITTFYSTMEEILILNRITQFELANSEMIDTKLIESLSTVITNGTLKVGKGKKPEIAALYYTTPLYVTTHLISNENKPSSPPNSSDLFSNPKNNTQFCIGINDLNIISNFTVTILDKIFKEYIQNRNEHLGVKYFHTPIIKLLNFITNESITIQELNNDTHCNNYFRQIRDELHNALEYTEILTKLVMDEVSSLYGNVRDDLAKQNLGTIESLSKFGPIYTKIAQLVTKLSSATKEFWQKLKRTYNSIASVSKQILTSKCLRKLLPSISRILRKTNLKMLNTTTTSISNDESTTRFVRDIGTKILFTLSELLLPLNMTEIAVKLEHSQIIECNTTKIPQDSKNSTVKEIPILQPSFESDKLIRYFGKIRFFTKEMIRKLAVLYGKLW